MADRYELAFLKNALSVNITLNPQEQTALESLVFQRLLASNLQIDPSGLITGNFSPSAITFTVPDGTVIAPGLPFTNEGGTGRYRIAAGNVGESVLGVAALDWTGTRLQLTNLNLIFASDNQNDIGASGANRPRNLYLGGNAQINGTLQVLGAAGVVGTLIISGPVTFENPVSFSPDNTYDIGAGVLRPRDLFVGRNVTIGGTLNVTGATTLSGALNMSAISVGTLTVTGTTTHGGPVLFTPDNTFDIGASGTNRPRDLWMGRNVNVQGTLAATGPVTVGTGGLAVQGPASFQPDNTIDIGAFGANRPRDLWLGRSLNVPGSLIVAAGATINPALPIASGGTASTTLNPGGVLFGRGSTTPVGVTAAGTLGQPLLGQGAGANPLFISPTSNVAGGGGATISGAGNMLGLARTITFTATGKVFVMFVGQVTGGNATNVGYRIVWGTGTPPVPMQGPTGTPIGNEIALTPDSARYWALTVATYWFGYSLGVQYWFDLQLSTNTGNASMTHGFNGILLEVL